MNIIEDFFGNLLPSRPNRHPFHDDLVNRQANLDSEMPDVDYVYDIARFPRWELLFGLWSLTYAIKPHDRHERCQITEQQLKRYVSAKHGYIVIDYCLGRPIFAHEHVGTLDLTQFVRWAPGSPKITITRLNDYFKGLDLSLIGRRFTQSMENLLPTSSSEPPNNTESST